MIEFTYYIFEPVNNTQSSHHRSLMGSCRAGFDTYSCAGASWNKRYNTYYDVRVDHNKYPSRGMQSCLDNSPICAPKGCEVSVTLECPYGQPGGCSDSVHVLRNDGLVCSSKGNKHVCIISDCSPSAIPSWSPSALPTQIPSESPSALPTIPTLGSKTRIGLDYGESGGHALTIGGLVLGLVLLYTLGVNIKQVKHFLSCQKNRYYLLNQNEEQPQSEKPREFELV